MVYTQTLSIIECAVSAVLLAVGLAGYTVSRGQLKTDGFSKKNKKNNRLFLALSVISGWFLIGTFLTSYSTKNAGLSIEFEMFSERVEIFGITFASTTVLMWVIILLVLILSLIFRFVIFPRFSIDKPKGFQNIMEITVEAMENFTKGILGDYSDRLSPYMYSLAVFMIFSAVSELFGFRPPTSDIVVTFAMGIITFALINYYGIKKKGFAGRIKSMAKPTPVIFPMKILSDVAVPVSLACRLFGNMIGGMIVMDLLKSVLGGYATGIPAVAGLYFNLFHPLIQTYIFIILSLTFINEAIE